MRSHSAPRGMRRSLVFASENRSVARVWMTAGLFVVSHSPGGIAPCTLRLCYAKQAPCSTLHCGIARRYIVCRDIGVWCGRTAGLTSRIMAQPPAMQPSAASLASLVHNVACRSLLHLLSSWCIPLLKRRLQRNMACDKQLCSFVHPCLTDVEEKGRRPSSHLCSLSSNDSDYVSSQAGMLAWGGYLQSAGDVCIIWVCHCLPWIVFLLLSVDRLEPVHYISQHAACRATVAQRRTRRRRPGRAASDDIGMHTPVCEYTSLPTVRCAPNRKESV